MSLMARELYSEECKTPRGLFNAQKRIKYHINKLVAAKHLRAQRSPKGRMIGFERGSSYREFEQLYIAEGVDPELKPRVGSPTLSFEIHHIRGYIVVDKAPERPIIYGYDKPHSGVPHRIANFHKQPQHSTDNEIPGQLPNFKLLFRDGRYKKSFTIYITEPLDIRDRRSMVQHEEMIEQSLYDIRNWLSKRYHCTLGLPEIQSPTHYAFPVPKGVAEAMKGITDPNKDTVFGDTSRGRAHAETYDKITAGEIALLPDTLNAVREQMRAIREDKAAEAGRLDEIEQTIKEMALTLKTVSERQSQLTKMLSIEKEEDADQDEVYLNRTGHDDEMMYQ